MASLQGGIQLSAEELAGASLPEGIDVDEAAAYFGIVESSASLHTLLDMSPNEALLLFLEMTSDLHLAGGDFDFETASQRMNCEGGEIYYLVSGNLGMMKLSDSLRRYLGMEDSEGEPGGPDPGLPEEAVESLQVLCDPMSLLQVLSIAFMHGGNDSVQRYLGGLAAMFSNPAGRLDDMKMVVSTLEAVLHSFRGGGGVAPIPGLAQSPAMTLQDALSSESASTTESPATIAQAPVASPEPTSSPSPQPAVQVEPVVKTIATSQPVSPVPLPGSQDAPSEPEVADSPVVPKPISSVLQPKSELVPLPIMEPATKPIDNRKEEEKEFDAFAGAFGMQAPSIPVESPPPSVVAQPLEDEVAIPTPVSAVSLQSQQEQSPSLEGVSMQNMLDSITTSGSAMKSDATTSSAPDTVVPVSMPEQPEQPMTFNEPSPTLQQSEISQHVEQVEDQSPPIQVANVDAEDDSGLPKPIRASPVRAPVNSQQAQSNTPQANSAAQYNAQQAAAIQQQQAAIAAQQAQQAAQEAARQQQALAAQQAQQAQQAAQQAQQAAQSYQPTIRSGVHCQGCGIGLDPTWNHCPVCGTASV